MHAVSSDISLINATFVLNRQLGEEWSIKQEVVDDLESFSCLMYGYAREASLYNVRSIMLKSMVGENEVLTSNSKVDLSRLPPSRDNLIPHINRVNHRRVHYKRADKAIYYSPEPHDGQGWKKGEGNTLEPEWSCGPILPSSLIDLLEKTVEEIEEREPDDNQDSSYDEIFSEE